MINVHPTASFWYMCMILNLQCLWYSHTAHPIGSMDVRVFFCVTTHAVNLIVKYHCGCMRLYRQEISCKCGFIYYVQLAITCGIAERYFMDNINFTSVGWGVNWSCSKYVCLYFDNVWRSLYKDCVLSCNISRRYVLLHKAIDVLLHKANGLLTEDTVFHTFTNIGRLWSFVFLKTCFVLSNIFS